MSKRFPLLSLLAVVIFGAVCTVYFHRLEIRSGLDLLTGDRGDTRLYVFLFEHFWRSVLGKAEFLSPPMFFPTQGTLGYSDALWGFAPTYAALRWLKLDPYLATSLNFILLDLLSYGATILLLMRGLRLGTLASTLGAALFVFSSAKFNQLCHLQLQPVLFPPLILFLLLEAAKRAQGVSGGQLFAYLAAAGLLIDLQLVSSYYHGWFLCFWLLLVFIFLYRLKASRELIQMLVVRHRWPILAAGGVFLIGLIPFLRIYLPVLLEMGGRSYPEARTMLVDFPSLLWMGPDNHFWGWLAKASPVFRALPLEWEHRVGLGLIATVFWLVLTFKVAPLLRRKNQDRTPRWLLEVCGQDDLRVALFAATVLAVSALYLLAFKYLPRVSPWAIVFHIIPGASGVRAVARFVILLWLPISMVFAVLLNHVLKRQLGLHWKLGALLLACLALAEQAGTTQGFSASVDRDRIAKLARSIPENCPSFYLRTDSLNTDPDWEIQIDAMLASNLTGIPTLNGYSGQRPPGWNLENLRNTFSRQAASQWLLAHQLPPSACEVFYR